MQHVLDNYMPVGEAREQIRAHLDIKVGGWYPRATTDYMEILDRARRDGLRLVAIGGLQAQEMARRVGTILEENTSHRVVTATVALQAFKIERHRSPSTMVEFLERDGKKVGSVFLTGRDHVLS